MLEAGGKAPEFTLRDTAGSEHRLAPLLRRGPALIVLYKVSCPTCQLTAPYLERLANGSLQVITISQDNAADTQRFQQAFGLTAPSLLDRKQDGYAVSQAFGITHVPSLFLVETDGTISEAGSGFVKARMEQLAQRAGVQVFRPEEHVPEWKAG